MQSTNHARPGSKFWKGEWSSRFAFYMLRASPGGAADLRAWISGAGLQVWFHTSRTLSRSMALMEQYADQPMDFADASLVAAAEQMPVVRIFTLDRKHFAAYRVRRGHRLLPFEIV